MKPIRNTIKNLLLSCAAMATVSIATAQEGKFTVPDLPYAYDALVPNVDAKTMTIHHSKHHAGYVKKLNAALAGAPELADQSLEKVLGSIKDIKDEKTKTGVRNNGGGHYNHSQFWEVMAPKGQGGEASAALEKAIIANFGSIEKMKAEFAAAAGSQFGSGWAWLVERPDGKLVITSTANQDNPLMTGVLAEDQLGKPLFGIDVWEHAYYLNYQNRRADYITSWFEIINWKVVSERYAKK